jgi:hypothetical protein
MAQRCAHAAGGDRGRSRTSGVTCVNDGDHRLRGTNGLDTGELKRRISDVIYRQLLADTSDRGRQPRDAQP